MAVGNSRSWRQVIKKRDADHKIWGGTELKTAAMADPLSIAASTLTLLGAVAATAKGLEALRNIRQAPAQVTAVLNEITDLRLVTTIVENAIRNSPQDESKDIRQGIYELAKRAERMLKELDSISKKVFRYENLENGLKVPVLSRRAWLRHRSAVEQHCKNMRETRHNLTAALTALSSSQIGIRTSAHIVLQASVTKLEESISANLAQVHAQMVAVQTQQNSPPISPTSTLVEEDETNSDRTTKRGEQPPALFSIEAVDTIESCEAFCPCECHVRKTMETPRWLRSVIGSLFYSYAGSPVFGRHACNYVPCKNSGAKRGHQYTYHFPHWMVAGAVSLCYNRNHIVGMGGSWTYNIPRMLTDGDPIWRFVNSGTVPQLADMLPKHRVAPCDINKDGKSLLHFAVEFNRPDMCSYLLRQGVNQFFEDESGFSAAMMAMELVLPADATSERAKNTKAIQNLFSTEDVHDTLDFSPLHLAVLNMSEEAFAKQVKLNFSSINKQDALGRTPLMWAAANRHPNKVAALLRAGAATDPVDKHFKTALHWAVASKSVDAVSSLLEHGAALESRDIFGRTPIWEAGKAAGSHKTIKLLVAAGAEIDAPDYYYSRTPLHLASYHGQAANAESFLALGADIEHRASTGRTALLQAVAYNQAATVRVLLEHGARVDPLSSREESVLHLTARFGSVEIMELFARGGCDWTGVDVDGGRDLDGCTAGETFDKYRADVYFGAKGLGVVDEREAFVRLLKVAREGRLKL